MKELINYLQLATAYVKLNLKSQMEYRGAFCSQVAAMFLNNCVCVLFWTLFFSRFSVLRGWSIKDVITIWAICASSFGVAHAICGNAWFLPGLIARGELDVWLLYPRRLLPHLILGKISATAWGDALFGYAVYFLFVQPDCPHAFLFIGLSVVVAFLFVGFSVLTGSLAFFLGNAEALAEQWRFALITFSTYPEALFEGRVKFLLYTAVPAGFVSYLPLQALHQLSWQCALMTAAGSAAILFLGIGFFYAGLRRYESGNLMDMRS
jgi:ABC-2 type transport system permease protein